MRAQARKDDFLEGLGEVAWPTTMVLAELAYYTSHLGGYMQFPTEEHHGALRVSSTSRTAPRTV